MAKIEIHYHDAIDASTKQVLQAREKVVREGVLLGMDTSWLRWISELDDRGREFVVLTHYSNPGHRVLALPRQDFERMSDDQLKVRIAGLPA